LGSYEKIFCLISRETSLLRFVEKVFITAAFAFLPHAHAPFPDSRVAWLARERYRVVAEHEKQHEHRGDSERTDSDDLFWCHVERLRTSADSHSVSIAKRYTPCMNKDIAAYNRAQDTVRKGICTQLAKEIDAGLPKAESKIWHRTAVWFLEGNPVVGYAPRKVGVQLLFWSGQSFDEPGLSKEGSFKAADKRYESKAEIKSGELKRWLKKAAKIQWDYKNIVKRKGKLVRLK
jgi:hypothetical protein